MENELKGFRLLMRGSVEALLAEEWVGYYTLKENKFSGIRAAAQPLGLILFVVDSFGMLKESHGKEAGNKCLRKVADTLMANTFRPD